MAEKDTYKVEEKTKPGSLGYDTGAHSPNTQDPTLDTGPGEGLREDHPENFGQPHTLNSRTEEKNHDSISSGAVDTSLGK